MGDAWWQSLPLNAVSMLLIIVILGSMLQGARRGASSSARALLDFVLDGAATCISVALAWYGAERMSSKLQLWMSSLKLEPPGGPIGVFRQVYYTFATGIRDFSLLRFAVLFLIGFVIARLLTTWILRAAVLRFAASDKAEDDVRRTGHWLSGLFGGGIGLVIGLVRTLLVIAVLFMYASLFPHSAFTAYVQASDLYQRGADQVIRPVAGGFVAERLPVFTRAVEQEISRILQRKYELIDAGIPEDIELAALGIVRDADSDEEKARLLYEWVGTRVAYDWEKVRLYEEEGIWKEQAPADTFELRSGVCIDYSRLYAVMARAVGLEVAVVTGLGYDGRGGYGSHAWNEVYLADRSEWIPLDSTWAAGGNWFNPPDFYETHIKDA